MKSFFLCCICCFSVLLSFAQESYTLSASIIRAIQNNPSISIELLTGQQKKLLYSKSKLDYLPSISTTNQNSLSTGRVLDPTTYQFVTNRTVYDMNVMIGGTMTLFSGFERLNNVKKAYLSLQSALLETEKTKNDIALNVTALFLNIVLDKEAIEICEQKISMLEEQEIAIQRKLPLSSAQLCLPKRFLSLIDSQPL